MTFPLQAHLFKYAGIAALLGLVFLLHLWKRSPPAPDPFFSRQRWTFLEVVGCFLIADVIADLLALLFEYTPNGWTKVGLQLLGHAVPILVFWVFFVFYVKQSFSVAGLSCKSAGPLAIVGVRASLLVWLIVFVLILITGQATVKLVDQWRVVGTESIIASYGLWGAAFYYFFHRLWIVGFASITEELAYRGLLYGVIRRHIGFVPAMLISSGCFMFAHLQVNVFLFGFGCLAAYLVERYHSLIPSICAHFVWDFAIGLHNWFVHGLHLNPRDYFQVATVVAAILLGLTYIASHRLKIASKEFEDRVC